MTGEDEKRERWRDHRKELDDEFSCAYPRKRRDLLGGLDGWLDVPEKWITELSYAAVCWNCKSVCALVSPRITNWTRLKFI